MSQTYEGGPVAIDVSGFTAATGAASARTAIPVDRSGNLPRYVRVAGINECYVRIGDVNVVATSADTLIQPADSLIMAVLQRPYIAYIQGTAAGKVNVVPLENV